jgi:hypothetical protein
MLGREALQASQQRRFPQHHQKHQKQKVFIRWIGPSVIPTFSYPQHLAQFKIEPDLVKVALIPKFPKKRNIDPTPLPSP